MISFQAMDNATVNIAVSTSSQAVQVSAISGANQVRVTNNASATVFIRFGPSGVVASATGDIPLPAGEVEVFSADTTGSGVLYVAAIAPSGTGNVYFTPGAGI